ncbi:MAG TPA: hypothetical protein H9903_14195 [Candidatus Aquabacterium excrementipullorum]|nr:hypothetical protein [Candidatus Aquabacterium excrementipullorum]
MNSSIKSAVVGSVLAAGLAFSGAASAGITLDTSALKADAVLQLANTAYSVATATYINFGALGNTTRLADGTEYDPILQQTFNVPRFNMPVTKATISIGWDLKVTANSGQSSRSALQLTRGYVNVTLGNFSIDFDKEIVYADVFTDGKLTKTKATVYSFDVVTPQTISFKNLVLNQSVKIGNLKLTQEAQDLLGDGLYIDAVLRPQLANLDFGTIAVLVTSYKRSPKANATPFTAADIPATTTP